MKALLKAAHFGPTVLVVAITFLLARAHLSVPDSLRVALAIFAGQLIVGWSNDLIDYPLDLAAGRMKKPLVSGEISSALLTRAIRVEIAVALALSYFSPLGLRGTVIHTLGVLSATAYNVKLKATIWSPIPYALSFGALPWAIYLAGHSMPPIWLYLDFIFISVAFHFLNVIKDLEWDINQGVLGLPQRIGRSASIAMALILVALAITSTLVLR